MKKNGKLYISRFVPYSARMKRQKIFMFKTAAVTLAICAVIVSATVFAARKIPPNLYEEVLKNHSSQEAAKEAEKPKEAEYICLYPEPDAETREKADRLREFNLEDYNRHAYIPADGEMDNVYVYDNKKMCYLTFDDGPSKVTPEVLEILKRYNVKATFFVMGNQAQNNKELIKRIYDEGHAIGNHSFSHDYNTVYGSAENFANELQSCKNAIDASLGFEYKNLVFRFPGGYTSLNDENTKSAYVSVLKEAGYKFIEWSCLTGDSNVTDPSAGYLLDTLRNGIGNSKTGDIVVLMHDSSTKQITADVLPEVIEYLQSCGYEFGVLKNEV